MTPVAAAAPRSRRFTRAAQARYATGGLRRVEGWLTALDAQLVIAIGDAQEAWSVAGAVGEIGVHHGRLFLLLYFMLISDERAFAVDVFDRQDLNVDRSGLGDLDRFLGNCAKVAGRSDLVEIFATDSTQITADEIRSRLAQPVRLISIDGGHTPSITMNDLTIADDLIRDSGVVIIDDYFNRDWPGVSQGVATFMAMRPGRLAAAAVGENKVFLCRPDTRDRYVTWLLAHADSRYLCKTTEFFGEETPIFRTPRSVYERLSRAPRLRALAERRLVRSLKPLLRRALG